MVTRLNAIALFCASLLLATACEESTGPEDLTTLQTIKSVEALLFSVDENGNAPVFDEFRPEELGISVYPDSAITIAEATVKPDVVVYTNSMSSLDFFTVYDFDEDHPAGSNVNELLLIQFPSDNEVIEATHNGSLSTIGSDFKFASVPQNDSLQFRVTGTIVDEGPFEEITQLVIFN